MRLLVVFDVLLCVFFFFKQKTAYEMRISDWSSDVCSSDLGELAHVLDVVLRRARAQRRGRCRSGIDPGRGGRRRGRADSTGWKSCRITIDYPGNGRRIRRAQHSILNRHLPLAQGGFRGLEGQAAIEQVGDDRKRTRLNSS